MTERVPPAAPWARGAGHATGDRPVARAREKQSSAAAGQTVGEGKSSPMPAAQPAQKGWRPP
eukprot:6693857-Pyramimonas_sp.AAC.1